MQLKDEGGDAEVKSNFASRIPRIHQPQGQVYSHGGVAAQSSSDSAEMHKAIVDQDRTNSRNLMLDNGEQLADIEQLDVDSRGTPKAASGGRAHPMTIDLEKIIEEARRSFRAGSLDDEDSQEHLLDINFNTKFGKDLLSLGLTQQDLDQKCKHLFSSAPISFKATKGNHFEERFSTLI